MAALSVVFDSLALHTEPNGPYIVSGADAGIDIGAQAIADALLTGQLRPEEYDQAAAEQGLLRVVTLDLKIKSASADAARTAEQALIARVAAANRYAPKTLTITPNASTHVSSFTVYGGSWQSPYTQVQAVTNTILGTLTLLCDWPVRGASQSLGSSGSPLITNTASPANVTLTPSPIGDVPGDVTVFVKNRGAAAIGSLIVAGIGGNTTWTTLSDSSAWTVDANGTRDTSDATSKNTDKVTTLNVITGSTGVVYPVAHFTAPTLPADRLFRLLGRVRMTVSGSGPIVSARVRLTSGQAEVIGEWVTLPQELPVTTWAGVDFGSFHIPVGDIGALGAQATTVYIEATPPTGVIHGLSFDYCLFLPADSMLLVETIDTSKTLAAATGIVRVESDSVYDASGNPAGGVVTGSHVRTTGGRYVIHASTGYTGTINAAFPWDFVAVDAWFQFTPRYIGLA